MQWLDTLSYTKVNSLQRKRFVFIFKKILFSKKGKICYIYLEEKKVLLKKSIYLPGKENLLHLPGKEKLFLKKSHFFTAATSNKEKLFHIYL